MVPAARLPRCCSDRREKGGGARRLRAAVVIARHGARRPTRSKRDEVLRFAAVVARLAQVQVPHEESSGSEAAARWARSAQAPGSDLRGEAPGGLVQAGRDEMAALAAELLLAGALGVAAAALPTSARATTVPRTRESCLAFAAGLEYLGRGGLRAAVVPGCSIADPLLRTDSGAHDAPSAKGSRSSIARDLYGAGWVAEERAAIERGLGAAPGSLDEDADVFAAYFACQHAALGWRSNGTSPAPFPCRLVGRSALSRWQYERIEDQYAVYQRWGAPAKLRAVEPLIAQVMAHLDSARGGVALWFSHDSTLQPLLARLGLFGGLAADVHAGLPPRAPGRQSPSVAFEQVPASALVPFASRLSFEMWLDEGTGQQRVELTYNGCAVAEYDSVDALRARVAADSEPQPHPPDEL